MCVGASKVAQVLGLLQVCVGASGVARVSRLLSARDLDLPLAGIDGGHRWRASMACIDGVHRWRASKLVISLPCRASSCRS
jgi:hypothetical protein